MRIYLISSGALDLKNMKPHFIVQICYKVQKNSRGEDIDYEMKVVSRLFCKRPLVLTRTNENTRVRRSAV